MQRCETVMIVEDDAVARSVLQAYFASIGAKTIIEVENGQGALDALTPDPAVFDLIVCDLNMPVMDGLQLITHLKRLNFKGGLIIITGEHGAILNAAEEIAIASNLKLLASLLKPLTKRKLDGVIGVEQVLGDPLSPSGEISPTDIQRLMNEQSILVHYQPVVDMLTGQVVSVEALARCVDPLRGILAAKDIVPIALGSGLGDELSNMITLKVLGQLNNWRSRGLAFAAGINVSASQFLMQDFPDKFVAIMDEFALDPSSITVEVSEPCICQNLGSAMMSVARLRLHGFGVAIDDCGTSGISFDRLKRLPATELKIDRTYVAAASTDEFAREKLQDIIEIAGATNVQLVAKGVETQQQWDLMVACGINAAQGYLIAKPMAAGEFECWFAERRDPTHCQTIGFDCS